MKAVMWLVVVVLSLSVVYAAAPSIAAVRLNSTFGLNVTAENLTAYIINASDADLDYVKNLTNWYVNGRSLAALNMPMEAHAGDESTRVLDYSGGGHNGSVSGPTFQATGGRDGRGAYQFSSNSISIPDSADFNFVDEMSLSIWFSTTDATANGQALIVHGTSSEYAYLVWMSGAGSSDNFEFYQDSIALSPQSTGCAVSEGSLFNGAWHQIAFTYNRSNVRMFLDGVLCATNTHSAYPTIVSVSDPISLGQMSGGSSYPGKIDDVLVFNRTLSDAQIYAIFSNQSRIVSQELVVGDRWRMCATPNDGTSDGGMVCSGNLTVDASSIKGLVSQVNTTGVTSLGMYVNGVQNANITTGSHTVEFRDGSQVLYNFTHNFSQGSIDLSRLSIQRSTDVLIVDVAGQLALGETKSMTMNTTMSSVCVKDAQISSPSEISDSCTGPSESRFSSSNCPGSVNGITCSKVGNSWSFSGLQNSGLEGQNNAIPELSTWAILIASTIILGHLFWRRNN